MGKRWSKQKAKGQKSKRRKQKTGAGGVSSEGAGGTMGGFRRGLRAIAGTGGKKKGPKGGLERIFDIVLWVAVAAALAYFVSKQCM